jgi:ribonucleoside-diphosphate reductase beta chain
MSKITAPEIKQCVAMQLQQEAIHNNSYQVIIEAVIPKEQRNSIYDYWRTDLILRKRCNYIAQLFQAYVDKPTKLNYGIAIFADYLLEGLYFYSGFQFFYNLSSRNLMQGTADMIQYINRDELSHVRLYQKMMPELFDYTDIPEDTLLQITHQAVESEIQWNYHICGDGILGFDKTSVAKYVRWLADTRLRAIGLPTLYDVNTNPFKHLDKIADTSSDGNVKGNFFEATVTSYSQSTSIDGWDF